MMMKFLAVCVVFFLAGVDAKGKYDNKGKYKHLIVGDFCVKIEGKSGKITIIRTVEELVNTTSNDTDSNAQKKMKKPKPCEGKKKITVDFDDLLELDQNGKEVQGSKNQKHRFKNFAQHDFNVSEPQNVKYQELSAHEVSFSSKINGADFKVYIYIFNETGNITNGDEVKSVAKGTVKFTIKLNNWLFCGNDGSSCKNDKKGEAVGKYIEMVLKIKGRKEKPDNEEEMKKKKEKKEKEEKEREEKEKKEREKGKGKGKGKDDNNNKPKKNEEHKRTKEKRSYHCKKHCGKKYDLGDNDQVVMFKTVKVNGSYIAMPEGFPRLEKRGSHYVFVLRFPKGENITYDPTIEVSGDVVPPTSEEGKNPDGGNPDGGDKDNNKKDSGGSVACTSFLVAMMLLMSFLFCA